MEHGKNMDYAEEIKALKKALAERDAIIAKQKRDYDALEAKFRKLQEKLEEKVKELEAIQEKRRENREGRGDPGTSTGSNWRQSRRREGSSVRGYSFPRQRQ